MLLAGCGRLGFDLHEAPGRSDASIDAALLADGPLPSGLVSWFPLDDATAQDATDVITGIDGTCDGAQCPTTTAGHTGAAFLFDGVDDCIEVPSMGQFDRAQITISIWIRQDISDNCSPIAKPADTVGTTANTWQIETNTNDQLAFTTSHGATANARVFAANDTLVVGQWQHLAATYDGTTKRLYVDGTQVASGSVTPGLTYDVQPLWIGCDNNSGAFAMRFNGAIDEFQLYDRALAPTEIQMLAAM